MKRNKPFMLKPAAKEYLWGGRRLADDYGKAVDASPLAETWECSTHPDGQSLVEGMPLGDVLAAHPEYIGVHPMQTAKGKTILPVMVKLIDAKKDLSIQVHPDDDYALRVEGQLGKTELWYVLSAAPGAELVYGFNQDMSVERLRDALESGTIEKYLNHVPVKKDDIFFIDPGTVHSIGAGCLLAEIQESSNITYRLYDYERKDSSGAKRELHVDKALEVINLSSSAIPRQPMRVLRYKTGYASELLSICRYFRVERMLLNTEADKEPGYQTGSNSFHVLLCTEGYGAVFNEEFKMAFQKGDCLFIPADSVRMKLQGRGQLLDISC